MAFVYPPAAHSRRHGPRGYADYPCYKDWLRDEFMFRCVYCLHRETWTQIGAQEFSADHVVPQVAAPNRVCDYDNLVYACVRCNALKAAILDLPDPTRVSLAQLVCVNSDGTVSELCPQGARLVRVLQLNGRERVRFRRQLLATIRMLQTQSPDAQGLLTEWLGFPDALPDLAALRPPGGNSRPGGVADSWFVKRQQNQLPSTY